MGRSDEVNKELLTATEIIICEGLATGISIAEFRHHSLVISAIDAGNLIHVAKAIREVNATVQIIIAGDNDVNSNKNTGKEKAIEAAKAINGYWQQFGLQKTSGLFDKNLSKINVQTLTNTNNQNLKKLETQNMNLSQMASNQRAELLNQYYDNNLAINLTTDEIYYYQANAWQPISDKVLMRTLADLFNQSGEPFNPMRISSAVETLRLSLPAMGRAQTDLICFKNGVYELKT